MDTKEVRFLGDFWEVMRHAHYKFLGRQEWEKALSEDFMVGGSWDCAYLLVLPLVLAFLQNS